MPLLRKNGSRKRVQERLRLVTARHKIFLWPHDSTDPIPGFGFVSDFSDEGVGFYIGQKLKLQTPVRISFEDAGSVSYRGTVIWTARINQSQNFIGHSAMKYRMGIRFLFGTEAERKRYCSYYEDVLRRVQAITLGI